MEILLTGLGIGMVVLGVLAARRVPKPSDYDEYDIDPRECRCGIPGPPPCPIHSEDPD